MLALLVLIPLTAGFEYWVEGRQGPGNPLLDQPVVVESGKEQTYAGATWKLELAEPGPTRQDVRLPSDLTLVYVVLSVTPKDAKASKRIASCRFQGTDGDGRVWSSSITLIPMDQFDNPMTGCVSPEGEFGTAPIRPGTTQRVLTAFLVPKDEVKTLRVRVLLGPNRRPLDLMT